MVIRDDRGAKAGLGHATALLKLSIGDRAAHFAPDAVLYDCPDCGRAHFVTVDACPDAETAAREAGMVRRAA